MKTKLAILVFAFILIPILNAYAAETAIPDWIKNNAGWWADGQIDDGCLLYTSPSPRDKRQSRMPSSA